MKHPLCQSNLHPPWTTACVFSITDSLTLTQISMHIQQMDNCAHHAVSTFLLFVYVLFLFHGGKGIMCVLWQQNAT